MNTSDSCVFLCQGKTSLCLVFHLMGVVVVEIEKGFMIYEIIVLEIIRQVLIAGFPKIKKTDHPWPAMIPLKVSTGMQLR